LSEVPVSRYRTADAPSPVWPGSEVTVLQANLPVAEAGVGEFYAMVAGTLIKVSLR
jgi:hypothetical protein